jgi:hypothetical protein
MDGQTDRHFSRQVRRHKDCQLGREEDYKADKWTNIKLAGREIEKTFNDGWTYRWAKKLVR